MQRVIFTTQGPESDIFKIAESYYDIRFELYKLKPEVLEFCDTNSITIGSRKPFAVSVTLDFPDEQTWLMFKLSFL